MVMGMNPFMGQPQANLGQVSDATLLALSQQGNPQFSHAALMEQASAQRHMQEMAQQRNIEVPKVNFYPSRHPDPRKARRQDIKQAYRLLRPTKRSMFDPRRWLGSKYRYNHDTGMCVVDGCNVKELIQYDNLYARICDEESGRSLWEMYWQNPVTGEPAAFLASDGVMGGRQMRGTYCPEHLHLYHLACKWEEEEEKELEMQPSRLRDKVKKGVSFVTVPVSTIAGTDTGPKHPMVTKYEPFFAEITVDARNTEGIDVIHHYSPITGQNKTTHIMFNMEIFEKELMEMSQPTPAFQDILQAQAEYVANQQAQVQPPLPVQPEIATEGQV